MLKLGRERDELQVVDDQRGSPTHADDVADAIYVIVERLLSENPAYGTFHLTGSGETTWFSFAQFIFDRAYRFWGRRPKVSPILTSDFHTLAQRPAYSVLDTARYCATFGVEPPQWETSAVRALDIMLAKER